MKRVSPCFAALLCSLLLGACGFEPMAGTNTTSAAGNSLPSELASVAIEAHTNRDQRLLGQQFRIALEDLINPGQLQGTQKHYALRVHLAPLTNPGFIAPDGTAQRFLVNLRSTYELIDLRSNETIERGSLDRNSSYSNLPNSFFSTYVAEQDTLRRLSAQLAEEYRLKLASLITTPPSKPSKELFEAPDTIINPQETATGVPRIGSNAGGGFGR